MAAADCVGRGVWKVPHLVDGSPAAMAVDSRQRRVAVVVLHPGVDRRAVKRLLTAILDTIDPQPRLQLVQQDDAASIRAWVSGPSLTDDALLALLGGYGMSGTG